MIKRWDKIGSFSAVDANGKTYIIEIYVAVMSDADREDSNKELHGQKRLVCNGNTVYPLGQGKYEMRLPTGQMLPLTSTDPNAV